MSDICNIPKNAKYIDYKCIRCDKEIDEDERQRIIALGCVQTWCLQCISIRYPNDKHLSNYVAFGDDTVLGRNKLLNDL